MVKASLGKGGCFISKMPTNLFHKVKASYYVLEFSYDQQMFVGHLAYMIP